MPDQSEETAETTRKEILQLVQDIADQTQDLTARLSNPSSRSGIHGFKELPGWVFEFERWNFHLTTFHKIVSETRVNQALEFQQLELIFGVVKILKKVFNDLQDLLDGIEKSTRLKNTVLPFQKYKFERDLVELRDWHSRLSIIIDSVRFIQQQRDIPLLQESSAKPEDSVLNHPFVKSIPARYRRYLSPEHGLKFQPSGVHAIYIDLEGLHSPEDLTTEETSDDQIRPWVESVQHISSSTLKLLVGVAKSEDVDSSISVPLSVESFLHLFEKFDLPPAYLQSLFTGTSRSLRYSHAPGKLKESFVHRSPNSRSENWALTFTWNLKLQSITGIILGLLPQELETLFAFMKASRSELRHPMCLPLILCEMQTDSDSNNVKKQSALLFQVELETRMHSYEFADSLKSSEDLDYDDVTRKLNGIMSKLSFHQMRLEATLKSLEYIKGCEKHFRRDSWMELSDTLLVRIDQVADENTSLLAEVLCNQRIGQSQLDVVYNLVVQRDNKNNLKMAAISRDIAEAAKDDSSAMRTLAFMSILFLPATFVASFFSMSMFDWKASQWSQVAAKRLWLYWAVSVPLTLIIMAIWYIWLRRDIDQDHIVRRRRHIQASAGFKDISLTFDEKTTATETSRPSLYARLRRKKHTEHHEAGTATTHSHRTKSGADESHTKPPLRSYTGQGPRR